MKIFLVGKYKGFAYGNIFGRGIQNKIKNNSIFQFRHILLPPRLQKFPPAKLPPPASKLPPEAGASAAGKTKLPPASRLAPRSSRLRRELRRPPKRSSRLPPASRLRAPASRLGRPKLPPARLLPRASKLPPEAGGCICAPCLW